MGEGACEGAALAEPPPEAEGRACVGVRVGAPLREMEALPLGEREAAAGRGEAPPARPTADWTDGFVEDVAAEGDPVNSLQLAPEATVRRMLLEAAGDADAVFRALLLGGSDAGGGDTGGAM